MRVDTLFQDFCKFYVEGAKTPLTDVLKIFEDFANGLEDASKKV